jgi:hypothetical protein
MRDKHKNQAIKTEALSEGAMEGIFLFEWGVPIEKP